MVHWCFCLLCPQICSRLFARLDQDMLAHRTIPGVLSLHHRLLERSRRNMFMQTSDAHVEEFLAMTLELCYEEKFICQVRSTAVEV